jgi:cytochrome c oxidase subunit II
MHLTAISLEPSGYRSRRVNAPGKDRLFLVPLLAVVLLTGCGRTQSSLEPESHQARDIADLFWWMMGGAWIGLALVVGLLVWSWKRRNRRGFGTDTEGPKPGERQGWYTVIGLGIAMPIVVISTLFVISDLFVIKTTQAPAGTTTKLTVQVIGHQWWWEIRYPGTDAVTANELHIPVRTPVRIELATADVIHSFWVPQLNRKVDAIPDKTNVLELNADAPGRYRGQCSEFCGLQHAHMSMYVIAEPEADFDRWLAAEARPAKPASGGAAGEKLFMRGACSSCHAIRGTSAGGYVGPDLTHIASRSTLGALTIPNTRSNLADWIRHSQYVKPGNKMPDINLPDSRLREVVAYLESLK